VPGGLRTVALADWGSARGSPIAFHLQAQGAANSWSLSRAEGSSPEHLLVALIDQGNVGVTRALDAAGIDVKLARRKVLEAIGAPVETPPIPMPPLTPAGCGDRPALPVEELPSRVWGALRERQEHLPLARLHRRWHWQSLMRIERRVAWRLASRSASSDGSDPDRLYSLVHHHAREVERRSAEIAPHLAPRPPRSMRSGAGIARRRRLEWRLSRMFVGWPCWFGNRLATLRTGWFRLTTLHHYPLRHQLGTGDPTE
jgi:hypothetical protein